MVDQYLMSVCAPKAIAPVIDLTLAQQVICPSVPHHSERLEPAQALSLDVDKASCSLEQLRTVRPGLVSETLRDSRLPLGCCWTPCGGCGTHSDHGET